MGSRTTTDQRREQAHSHTHIHTQAQAGTHTHRDTRWHLQHTWATLLAPSRPGAPALASTASPSVATSAVAPAVFMSSTSTSSKRRCAPCKGPAAPGLSAPAPSTASASAAAHTREAATNRAARAPKVGTSHVRRLPKAVLVCASTTGAHNAFSSHGAERKDNKPSWDRLTPDRRRRTFKALVCRERDGFDKMRDHLKAARGPTMHGSSANTLPLYTFHALPGTRMASLGQRTRQTRTWTSLSAGPSPLLLGGCRSNVPLHFPDFFPANILKPLRGNGHAVFQIQLW
jgi:hypothetical protein